MKVRFLILIVLLVNAEINFAQQCWINFIPKFGKSDLNLNQTYVTANNQKIEISNLKFYISNIEFYRNDTLVWKDSQNPKLVNASQPASLKAQLNCKEGIRFNQVKFNVGIDSITNNAGAMGGDLDPTLGMYWTWQNGYINFKLEGKSNVCPSRNNEFHYHIGGYSAPFKALQQISLPTSEMDNILIEIDIEKIYDYLDISKLYQIMSPGEEALKFANLFPKIFRTKSR